ncbi:MAG: SIMPL domain-containing protein [Candidatus Magasanikbacteria bacterium]|nr:SIMPL domain-containing protein [Candidatus Magasanikbacteria bacterium]
MHQTIKNAIGIAVVVGIFVAGYAATDFVRSYGKSIQPTAFRSFTTTGEGREVAIPDVARFTFGVNTEGDKDIPRLQKRNAQKANQAIAFIKANEVEDKDIHTTEYRVSPRYQYFPCNPRLSRPCRQPEIIGYSVRQTVAVKVRNFEKIGDLLAGVVGAGANEVSQLSFTIDDPAAVQQQARNEAIAQAKEKAKAVATAGDFRLGRLLAIEEGPEFTPYSRKDLDVEALGAPGFAAAAPTIQPGSQEIVVEVRLKYEID